MTNILNSSLFKKFISEPGCADFFKGKASIIPNNINNAIQNDEFKKFITALFLRMRHLKNKHIICLFLFL